MAEIKYKTKEEVEAEKNIPKEKTELEILKETVDSLVLANLLGGVQ
ncbi:hypothetical protein [Clostridium sp. UBA5119]